LVNIKYKGKKIASTIPGVYQWDGNGDKDKILEILEKTLTDVDAYIYDYETLSRRQENSLNMYKKRGFYVRKDLKGHKEFLRELNEKARERAKRRPNFDKD
jgi:hypothetical protein